MARERYAIGPVSAQDALFAARVAAGGGPRSREGVKARQAIVDQGYAFASRVPPADGDVSRELTKAVTDHAPSEEFQIVHGDRFPNGSANLSSFVSSTRALGPGVVLESGHLYEAVATRVAPRDALAALDVRASAGRAMYDSDQPMVAAQTQNGRHRTVRPTDVADATPRNPTPGWSAR